jgi:hypothetical protein
MVEMSAKLLLAKKTGLTVGFALAINPVLFACGAHWLRSVRAFAAPWLTLCFGHYAETDVRHASVRRSRQRELGGQ